MRNWKYINGAEGIVVGNKNYRYKDYLITKSDEDGEIIVYKPNGRDVAFRGTKSESMAKYWIDHNSKVGNAWTVQKEKRLDELARKGPSKMTRQEWEEFLRLEKESSLENQKFVKSLSKNSKTGNAEVIKDGDAWVVLYAEGTKSKEFDSEAEAKKFAAQVGNELNTGYFFKRLAADAHKEETRDNEKLKEIGNSDSLIGKTVWVRLSDGHKYKAEVLRDEGSRIYVKTPEGNQTWKLKREVEVLNENSYEAWKNKPAKKIGNSVHNLFLKFPSYEEAEDYINTKFKNKYKSVKVISKPHNGNGTYEIIAED